MQTRSRRWPRIQPTSPTACRARWPIGFSRGRMPANVSATAPGRLRLRDRPDPARLTGQAPPPENPARMLWYRQPARAWIEAMPLGNGRLGAMVFGGVAEERIQLNEDTLWSGAPHDYNHPGAFEHLAEIRKLIAEQKFDEARKLGDATMLGIPAGQASYQPLGDLQLTFDEPRRSAGLPARTGPGRLDRPRQLPDRRGAVHARGVHFATGPGHGRAVDLRPAAAVVVRAWFSPVRIRTRSTPRRTGGWR